MSKLKQRVIMGIALAATTTWMAAASAQDSGVNALPNRTFVHKDSMTAVKVPDGWNVIAPYRLRKSTASSVLGLEKEDPRIAVTIIWSPLGNRPFNEVIRAAEDDNLGEEYATLVTVYGKAKVSRPTTMKVGGFTVFKVLLDDGPDKEAKYAGAVYLFESGTGDNRWKIKVRAVYPQLNREDYIKQVEALLGQFAKEE